MDTSWPCKPTAWCFQRCPAQALLLQKSLGRTGSAPKFPSISYLSKDSGSPVKQNK